MKKFIEVKINDVIIGAVQHDSKRPKIFSAVCWNGYVVGYKDNRDEAEQLLHNYGTEVLKTTPGWGIKEKRNER